LKVLVAFLETEGKAVKLEDFVIMQLYKFEVKSSGLNNNNALIEKAVIYLN
jgi:hypothetical protein